jgi:gamma-polyglutamate biosynthesis protein CapC
VDLFPLAIFPEGSLSSSVIPVVWIGMSIVCFFNLRLGWVLSGLVVPGYLVPLMLIKPWAAGVVLFESVLTYFLVWFISEYLSRWASWCNFFGRDRFFALVLCSIVVRLVFDGWLLLELGEWATTHWHIAFDYRNNLHSFGLIIVSLVANQFWKTGFLKGSIPLVVTLGLTLLIVRYGLMELTNFSLSNISYLYEDMATSILATPKAYIIVVSTAFLASRMNLYYGWDFNGILIPSLLALQWYQPIKILATLAESCIILGLAVLLLKTPFLSKMTIEGARKLLLFFNISFAYKMLLGYVILIGFPAQKVTDFFGFGYLLSTLVAVKIHDKAIFARLTRATLQTSLTAVAGASLIGFTLTLLPISKLFTAPEVVVASADLAKPTVVAQQNLASLLQQEQVNLYQNKLMERFTPPSGAEIDAFSSALTHLQTYLKQPDPLILQEAREYLNTVNYRLEQVNNDRYLYLHEQAPLRGWGAYVIDTKAISDLSLEVPASLDETGIFDVGVGLFNGFGARSLAISGSHIQGNADISADVLKNPHSFFQAFHRLINRHNSLQLRVYSTEMARQIAGVRLTKEAVELADLRSSLWVKERLPDGLDLTKLKQLIRDFDINWIEPPFENQQRESSNYGFVELVLTKEDLRKLLFSSLVLAKKRAVQAVDQTLRIEGYLQEWILKRKQIVAPKGSQLYKPPKQEELLYLDEQVLTPLLDLIRHSVQTKSNIPDDDDELQSILQAADILGYQLIKYRDSLTRQEYFVLAEQEENTIKHWGMYVFRIGVASPNVVQIPRPLYEINSFEYGVSLFERLNAQALMIGTTHPGANSDGSADLINPNNKLSVFNLVNQVLMREAHDEPLMLINIRAFSYRTDKPFPDADVVFSLADGVVTRKQLDHLSLNLVNRLEGDGMKVQLIDGSEQTSGYEVGSTAQSFYLEATANKKFAVLWLSPNARASYRQQSENQLQAAQFNSLNIRSVEQDLGGYLQQQHAFKSNTALDDGFRISLTQYMVEQDVMRLQQVASTAKQKRYSLQRVIDRNSKQAFLLIQDAAGVPFALANLAARTQDASYVDDKMPLLGQVTEFINQRKTWLLRQSD